MSEEYSENGWVITVAAKERAGRRQVERVVELQSRRTDRTEAEREAEYLYLNDARPCVVVEAVQIAGAERVPGPRLPQD